VKQIKTLDIRNKKKGVFRMLQEKLISFQPEVKGNSMAEYARDYQESMIMYQAFKTGIFEVLDGSHKNAADVAQAIDCIPERTVFLLNALVAIGLLEKNDDLYTNSEEAQTFLVSGSKFYQGDMLELQLAPERRQQWEKLGDWLKEETSGIASRGKPDQVFNPSFVRAMAQGTLSNKGFSETISLIANHSSFQTARRLLDLGGGHGLYAIAFKQIKPELDAVVFDLPHVGQVTQEYSRQYGTNVGFHPGDFFKDELPAEQDIVLAFDVLYPAPTANKNNVLTKIYHALNPGGYLFIKQWFLDTTRTSPKRVAIFALNMSLGSHMSHICTLQEAEEILMSKGFQIEGSNIIGDSASTLLIARKKG
jgi:2-polyprenyl-3-methyl-5-hydroxy-6-metoxy-1,4-benzoquinol methylase